MASYKNPQKNTKMKSKFYSDTSSRKGSEKPKREKSLASLTKVVVRRLPPSMTEEMFIESVSPLAEYDYLAFINADSSLGSSAYSRAYINFKNMEDVYIFYDKFDGYVFVDQKGNEYPAMVEHAPFQKIPKRSVGKKKDARCGTIDEDADYLAFLESLTKPVTITLPPLEAVLEEIQAHDRELKANNGLIKVKTPLLEYIEQRKAEKLRSKEEKKEERRRKELERKKAREEERKKKKEIREHHKEMKKEQHKDDNSVLRPERGKEDYVSEGRQERSKADRDKERQKREEERLKMRKEKERLRREREKEERLRRMEDKAKHREEEKFKHKDDVLEEVQEEKVLASKPEGSKSKRYSEGRRKEREKDKLIKEEKDRERKSKEEQDDTEIETLEENMNVEKSPEVEESDSPRKEEKPEPKVSSRKRREKDPRVERRIRNKDRPAMALYRPGQSRLSSRMRQDREEGVETSSSSPSPVMPAGDQKKLPSLMKENTDSSRSDCKEESTKTKSITDDSAEGKSTIEMSQDDRSSGGEGTGGEVPEKLKNCSDDEDDDEDEEDDDDDDDDEDDNDENEDNISDTKEEKDETDNKLQEEHEDADLDEEAHSSSDATHSKTEESLGSASKDVKKYRGVKTMTFRRSVSRE